MKIYDSVKKEEVEIADYKDLIKIMKDGRQVDLYLKEKNGVSDLGRRALVQRQRHPLYPLQLLRGPRSGRFHRPQYLRSGERF